MVEFELPETFTEEFLALIPRQRYVINTMLAEGAIKSYSLAIDRSKLWAVMIAESEFDVLENIAQMPLSNHMTPQVSELMFHHAADSVMQFSLN
ncbi:MAG: hypothetical protein KDD06_05010 [Phaeodactylibacter sp.]|nr:hypothetical protein [Phaeodactylibacter sp.]MCB9265058.1 hypothetical protein [Lewinellaceae bacterium]MCB9287407.1 hypothetical protein [Lewinellaceae bacterium]